MAGAVVNENKSLAFDDTKRARCKSTETPIVRRVMDVQLFEVDRDEVVEILLRPGTEER
jgi:hypothetical protein